MERRETDNSIRTCITPHQLAIFENVKMVPNFTSEAPLLWFTGSLWHYFNRNMEHWKVVGLYTFIRPPRLNFPRNHKGNVVRKLKRIPVKTWKFEISGSHIVWKHNRNRLWFELFFVHKRFGLSSESPQHFVKKIRGMSWATEKKWRTLDNTRSILWKKFRGCHNL